MLHGLKYDFIEDLLINLRLLKPPPAVLAENGVMMYRIGQRKTNKPTVGEVDPDFLNEASFRTNSVQITDQKHFEQHDRIDARTPIILTIQGAAFFRDKRKVDGFIDFSKQVILGNKVFYVDCFGLKFPGWVRPEHIKTFLRNCFIPNSTKKAVDPSLSTASRLLTFWSTAFFNINPRSFSFRRFPRPRRSRFAPDTERDGDDSGTGRKSPG